MKYHTVRSIARQLDVAEMTIYRNIWSGRLSAVRVGRAIRIEDAALQRFLAQRFVA